MKTKQTSSKVSPTKQNKNENFQVIMKNKNEKSSKEVEKEKAKNERKAKRESVREQIKAAKNKPKPPMVFVGVNEDENPRPQRTLQRTPPKAQKKPLPDNSAAKIGGGMVIRDKSPPATKPLSGPVKRSPPRKAETREVFSESKPTKEISPPDRIDLNKIERKDKLQRSPAPSSRKATLVEESPSNLHEKQHSVPVTLHPMKLANNMRERGASPNYPKESAYEHLSPERRNYYQNSPKTYTYAQDPSELNNFEDRVDDLLSETRNKLDDFSPKTEFAALNQDYHNQFSSSPPLNMFYPEGNNDGNSVNYGNQMPQPQMMPMQGTYQGAPYQQVPYYQPMPVNQNMMPGQGYVQPMMAPQMQPQVMPQMQPQTMPQMQQYPSYPQQMVPEGMSQYGHPQAIPQNTMGGGQPMYQGFYPQAHPGGQQ